MTGSWQWETFRGVSQNSPKIAKVTKTFDRAYLSNIRGDRRLVDSEQKGAVFNICTKYDRNPKINTIKIIIKREHGIEAGFVYRYGYFYQVMSIPLTSLFSIFINFCLLFKSYPCRSWVIRHYALQYWYQVVKLWRSEVATEVSKVTHPHTDHARNCLTPLI